MKDYIIQPKNLNVKIVNIVCTKNIGIIALKYNEIQVNKLII